MRYGKRALMKITLHMLDSVKERKDEEDYSIGSGIADVRTLWRVCSDGGRFIVESYNKGRSDRPHMEGL